MQAILTMAPKAERDLFAVDHYLDRGRAVDGLVLVDHVGPSQLQAKWGDGFGFGLWLGLRWHRNVAHRAQVPENQRLDGPVALLHHLNRVMRGGVAHVMRAAYWLTHDGS